MRREYTVPVSIKLGKLFPICRIALVVCHEILHAIDIHVIRLESIVQRIDELAECGNFVPLRFSSILMWERRRRFSAGYIVEHSVRPSGENVHFFSSLVWSGHTLKARSRSRSLARISSFPKLCVSTKVAHRCVLASRRNLVKSGKRERGVAARPTLSW